MDDFEQTVERIKADIDKHGREMVPIILERVARHYSNYYFAKDDTFKQRLLSQFAELEKRIGETEHFDWLSAMEKYKKGL